MAGPLNVPANSQRPARRSRPRRLARALAGAAAIVLALVGLVYLAAWLSLGASGVARALIWMDADVDDYKRFPARAVAATGEPHRYETGSGYPDGLPADAAPGCGDLAEMLAANDTTAFFVIKDDRLIHEQYFNGPHHDSVQTSFSVAKSFNSALIGRAIADGYIASLDDPVTDYIPELLERDGRFARITLRHLLSMSSGLRYEETGLPWSDDAQNYYAADLRRLGLQDTEIAEAPGERFHYNNFNPMLVGMVLERATGMPVATYLSQTIWQPLGAEADATWSLDSEASGFEKMESGINARAIDFVKLGSLYLHRGFWRGRQILPAAWVDESTRYSAERDASPDYQYGWWTFRDEALGDFYAAHGNKGQFIFVFPSDRLVILRQGREYGDTDWTETIPAIARQMRRSG